LISNTLNQLPLYLEYYRDIFISVLSDLSVLMTTWPIQHWQLSRLLQPAMVLVVLLAYTNKL